MTRVAWPMYIGWCIGAGGTAIFVALIAASLSAAGVINMATAYVCLALAWVVVTTAIVFSEVVWRFPTRHRVLVALGASSASAIFLFGLGYFEYSYHLKLTSIVAGNQPMPSTKCPLGAKDFVVFFGSNVANFSVFPHTIIDSGRDQNNNPFPLFVIDRIDDTMVGIHTLRLFDRSGHILTRIDHNEIWINSNFRSKKINSSHLLVYDDEDNEVLDLNYLNKNTMIVKGIFRRPEHVTITIDDTKLSAPPLILADACFKNSPGNVMVDIPAR